MAKKDASTYLTVLLEQVRDQNKAVLEAVGDLQKNVSEIPSMKEDLTELKQDTKVIKAAVTDMSREQKEHNQRITKLETVRAS